MNTIGGFFCYDNAAEPEYNFFDTIRPKNGDLQFTMSGRCAIYYALNDLKQTDKRRVAYVPAYTCETVLAPFKKAGYRLIFYGISRDMTPIFDEKVLDEISVLSLCGYYGFCNYNREFVQKCAAKGIAVIEDTTHSIFSADGIDPYATYVVGSLRKWIGVLSGGFAIKTAGRFQPALLNADDLHLSLRRNAIHLKQKADPDDTEKIKLANDLFWDAELMLRDIFDAHQSDEESLQIMQTFDYQRLINKRRSNYRYLLEHVKPSSEYTIVFPVLTQAAVPSHFTIYINRREQAQEYLKSLGIHSTAYWPKDPDINLEHLPETAYIYEHVLSLPCDQRYGEEEMERICQALNHLPIKE